MCYFTLEELIRSETAHRNGWDNTPPADARANLEALIERLLDPVREAWGGPITVSSGYRSPQLNRAVGGAACSQHLAGEAADITAGNRDENRRLFRLIRSLASCGVLEFDQLIDEQKFKWIHLSYRCGRNRGQVLHL